MKSTDKMYINIKKVLEMNGGSYSELTISSYCDRIKWIKDNLNIKTNSLTKILNNNNVINIIESSTLKDTSRKAMYIAIFSIARNIKISKNKRDEYKCKMDLYNDKDNKIKGIQKNKDETKWCKWEDLCNVFDKMPENTYEDIQDKIIMGLYTKLDGYICRLDYGELQIVKDKPIDKTHNYLVNNKSGTYILLNEYKTHKYYGQQMIPIKNITLIKLLNDIMNSGNIYVLSSYRNKNKPLGSSNLGKRIPIICQRYLNKPITLNTVRQIGETNNINNDEYNNMSINDKTKVHNKLQHSFAMGHYYAKVDK